MVDWCGNRPEEAYNRIKANNVTVHLTSLVRMYQVRFFFFFDTGDTDMYKRTQVADVVLMTSGAVNGVGPERCQAISR